MNETMQIETEQSEVAPLQRQGHLETDTFCDGCGYNLHGQPVARDPRLGLLVCRCPECGGWHAAGKGTTAASLWLSRVGTLALGLWVLIVLFGAFWACVGFGACQVVHVETFSYRKMVTPDGREVEWSRDPATLNQPVLAGTTQPVTQWTMVATLQPPRSDQRFYHYRATVWDALAVILGAVSLGFAWGAFVAIVMWHWKKRRYLWAAALPLATGAFVLGIFITMDERYASIMPWVARIIFLYALLQAAFTGVGILLGRRLARGVLRMIIPPRPRQIFAFLWHADGKKMPGPAPVGA